MLFTFDAVMGLVGTIALMALLSVAYGALTRALARPAWSQAALGGLFGAVAILAMFNPVHVAPGVLVDLRGVPEVLAGAFLGLPGAAVTTLMALAVRFGIGGAGMVAGSTSIVLVALVGLAWDRWVLCQRCHMLHDAPEHRRTRWRKAFRPPALGDLFRPGGSA